MLEGTDEIAPDLEMEAMADLSRDISVEIAELIDNDGVTGDFRVSMVADGDDVEPDVEVTTTVAMDSDVVTISDDDE